MACKEGNVIYFPGAESSEPIASLSDDELEEERRDYFISYLLFHISSETNQPLEEVADNFERRFFCLKKHSTNDGNMDEREAWIVKETSLESLLEISQSQLQWSIQQYQSLPKNADVKTREIASLFVFRWNRINAVLETAIKPNSSKGAPADIIPFRRIS